MAEGLRAGLSVAVVIALTDYLALPLLREAALAALLACICDPGDPIRRRVPVVLGFTLIGAITVGYGLLRGLDPTVALPLIVFGLFCSSFARIHDQAPSRFPPQMLRVWCDWITGALRVLALDRTMLLPRPAGAEVKALLRIDRQIELHGWSHATAVMICSGQ